MKNTPYEGTHVQPAVKPQRLEREEKDALAQQMREEARRRRQAAREQRRRERNAPKPEKAAKGEAVSPPSGAQRSGSDASLSERSPAKRVREEKGRGRERSGSFRRLGGSRAERASSDAGGSVVQLSPQGGSEAARASSDVKPAKEPKAPKAVKVPKEPKPPKAESDTARKEPRLKRKLPHLAASADPGQGLIASARHRRGFGESVPPASAPGSGGPLSPVNKQRRRIFLLATVGALLLLAVLAFLLTKQSDASARRQYMSQASASYAAGDYDAALRALRRAEQIEVDDACLVLMADCYQAQGNLDKALEVLRRMDKSDESVTQRIAELERRRQEAAESAYLSVAGRRLSPDTRSLILDGQGLTDAVLPEIAQLYSLDSLSLMDNELTDIGPLSVLGGLDTLNLSGNRITDLSPLSRLTELRTLYLDGNPVTDLSPLYALHDLTTLSVCGIELDALQLQGLAQALPNCAIRSDTPRSATTDITLGSITFKSDVTDLDLSGSEIHDIRALSVCSQLRFLDLGGNAISDLTPLMNLPKLETLDISDNLVTDLRPLMGLTKLRSLDASGNRIADTAAVGAMSGLTALDLSDNPLTDLSGLRKLSNLHSLSLKNTGLYDGQLIYLEQLSLLANLFLDDNPSLSNEAMGRLQSALPGCHVSFTELVYMVSIGGYEQPSNAKVLELSSREIVDVTGIDQMTELETVDLSGNNINNIYILQYSPSRDTIRTLNLADNQLTDITALSALTAIESLDLRINNISSLQPLMNLQTLRLVYLGGNPLSEQQVQALREALPDCVVSLE